MTAALRFAVAIFAMLAAGRACANPDVPIGADTLHLPHVAEWRLFWVCARRVSGSMNDHDLASQNAFPEVEAKCAMEKANFLLAQLDRAPRGKRADVASYVDMFCALEAMEDVLSVEVYRHPAAGISNSGSPSNWDDPNDPLNR